jgi:cell wall-associated NlpC family hydrolase
LTAAPPPAALPPAAPSAESPPPTASRLDARLHAFRPDLADARLRGQVPATAFADATPARVAWPSCPLLRRPEAGAPMDSQLLHGEDVAVFERRDGWAWVQAATDGYVGYVQAAALTTDAPPPTHRVAVGQCVVLADAEQIAAPLHGLSLGARVSVVAEGRRFHRLATGGYVFAAHLAPLGQRATDWVGEAERLLGLPYLWGGRGHGGIDCSGLVQVALAACGIACPRDSDQQAATVGVPLPLDPAAWQHGDLLYTRGHVLIARGDDGVIHATGHRWAVVTEARADALVRLAGLDRPTIAARRPLPRP